ncbi:MAG: PCRF domain-containing protein, partial [Pseudomonadota bacterium]
MRAETQSLVDAIESSLELLRARIGWEDAELRLEELNARSEDPTLWDNPAHAQKVMRDRQKLESAIEGYKALAMGLSDNVELIELGEAEGDAEIVSEAEAALAEIRERAGQKEIEALLSGEADGSDTFLEIHAGAGGTESCDWASMLARMYVRWAEQRGYKVELMSETPGEEAGLKSATYQIK